MFDSDIQHKNGIEWFKAPIPWRWHKCFPQTTGWVGLFTYIERCPCGAIRMDRGTWLRRNERRKK